MPHLHHGAMESSGAAVVLTLLIVFLALVYVRGWMHLRSTSVASVPAWRAGSFLLGLFLIWVPMASPIAAFDHQLLTVHMIQHLLLMTLAPPLLWLGEPLMAFASSLPRRFVNASAFRSQLLLKTGKILTQPAFC